MDEEYKRNQKNADDKATNNHVVHNIETNVSSVLGNRNNTINDATQSKELHENGTSENDTTNSMRIILPVFLENEQKHAQVERKRQIQSSPAKSVRRFSQDSAYLDRQKNVSLTDHIRFFIF